MAFLDNESSITIDAVLTTSGRRRLASGDGSFNISAFALGDDEINYELFNPDHSQGSAYYDLNILKTPVLEAFSSTNAGLRHKLMTIPRKDILHLPVLRLNTNKADKGNDPGKPLAGDPNTDMYVVLCTKNGFDAFAGSLPSGFIDGRDSARASAPSQLITLDQGLDTDDTTMGTWENSIDADLNENQFILQADDRFTTVLTPAGAAGGLNSSGADAAYSFIDEDNIATYYAVDPDYYYGFPSAEEKASVITGPRGTRFKFGCRCSASLRNSNFLFKKFGRVVTTWWSDSDATTTTVAGSTSARVLDTTIRVSGNKTGITLDIPVRFVREND